MLGEGGGAVEGGVQAFVVRGEGEGAAGVPVEEVEVGQDEHLLGLELGLGQAVGEEHPLDEEVGVGEVAVGTAPEAVAP